MRILLSIVPFGSCCFIEHNRCLGPDPSTHEYPPSEHMRGLHQCKRLGTYVLSIPAFVLAPVVVVNCPRLAADCQPHLSSLAANACETRPSTSKHPSPLISLNGHLTLRPASGHQSLDQAWIVIFQKHASETAAPSCTRLNLHLYSSRSADPSSEWSCHSHPIALISITIAEKSNLQSERCAHKRKCAAQTNFDCRSTSYYIR